MKILFINYNDLNSNSGIHVFNIANHLTRLGVECTVCIPDQKVVSKEIETALFNVVSFDEARRNYNHQKVDIIHTWTPREVVRLMTEELVEIYKCPYIVHLEDNEEFILEAQIGISFTKLSRLSLSSLDMICPKHLSHPIRYKKFLDKACGISVIIDTLREFCPPDLPSEVIWPGYEDEIDWALPFDTRLRQQLGIGVGEFVVVYSGNVHSANRQEVSSLYLAIGLLNRKGIRTKIVRTGSDHVQLFDKPLEEALKDFCINLGYVDRSKLPAILSLADVLVQPGKPDQFNNYRFPSKLPEYLATGKPVLLPATNIGRYLKDSDECILLRQGNAIEIAQKLEMLFQDSDLRKKIGAAGRNFAEKNLRWDAGAVKMKAFYQRLFVSPNEDYPKREASLNTTVFEDKMKLSQEKRIVGEGSINPTPLAIKRIPNMKTKDKIVQNHLRKSLPILDYATVRDFCDSADHFPQVMRFDGDLKDVQRAWMAKSIIGLLPSGAKLLEIGGGEPLVASVLQKLGYDVTIIDPYDGSGNGPQTYAQYVKDYPLVKLIKTYFDKDTPLSEKMFDCIFSISVLEHVPHGKLHDIFVGISKFLKLGGFSIHCTDLVIAGQMADWHDEGAREILFLQNLMQNPSLDEKLMRQQVADMFDKYYQKMAADLETYYHSAQGHNLWRGGRPYDEFPFRKIVSMQTCAIKN